MGMEWIIASVTANSDGTSFINMADCNSTMSHTSGEVRDDIFRPFLNLNRCIVEACHIVLRRISLKSDFLIILASEIGDSLHLATKKEIIYISFEINNIFYP